MNLLRVGLTGGIACGKSTIASFLGELGAFVIDADEVAHRTIASDGGAHAAVLERFGTEILDERGEIARPALARIVFADSQARRALDDIVHPCVRAEIDRRLEDCAARGQARIAIVEAALLVETGSYHRFHRLVVVSCSHETQIRRLKLRNDMSTDDATARIAAQATTEQRQSVANYTINTDRGLEPTRRDAERVWSHLLNDHEQRFGSP